MNLNLDVIIDTVHFYSYTPPNNFAEAIQRTATARMDSARPKSGSVTRHLTAKNLKSAKTRTVHVVQVSYVCSGTCRSSPRLDWYT